MINNVSRNITKEDAEWICQQLEAGRNQREICQERGFSYDVVKHIRRGDTFKEISSKYKLPELKHKDVIITNEIIKEICKKLEDNENLTVIASETHIPYTTIIRIKNREIYTNISQEFKFRTQEEDKKHENRVYDIGGNYRWEQMCHGKRLT